MKKVLFLLTIFLLMSANAYAAGIGRTIPFYETYSGETRFTVTQQTKPEKYNAEVQNGRLAIHTGNDSEYKAVMVQERFMPIAGGKLIVEYTMNIPQGSYLMAYADFPGIVSSEINQYNSNKIYPLMTFLNMSAAKINEKEIKDFKIGYNRDYRFSFEIDMDSGTFTAYLDGQQLSAKDGTDVFTISAKDIIGIEFRLESMTTGDNTVYVDDLYVHTDEKFYFVSPENGEDTANGEYKTPLKTVEKAVDLAAQNNGRIILLDGKYNLDSRYTLDNANKNFMKNSIIIEPYYNADISITGDYVNKNMDITAANERFRNKFRDDTKGDYSLGYSSYPIELTIPQTENDFDFDKATPGTTAQTNLKITNNGALDEEFSVILCIYDENNRLCSVAKSESIAENGSSKSISLDLDIPEGYSSNYNIKCFLWNSTSGMMPIGNISAATLEYGKISGSLSDTSAKNMDNGYIKIACKAKPNQQISILIMSENGKIAYMNQAVADSEGQFEMLCKTNKIGIGKYKVSISCMEE